METSTEELSPESKIIVYPSDIIINEILPSPTGSDSKEEWIEIFNQNKSAVDLSSWQIKDSTGAVNIYIFPDNTIINVNGYLVLTRPATKITLNNSGDGVFLLNPNLETVDSVSYESAPEGQSYSRSDSGWTWSETPTPGLNNIISITQEEEQKELEKENFQEEIKIATIGEQLPSKKSSFPIFLTALAVSLFSGITIFTLTKVFKMV